MRRWLPYLAVALILALTAALYKSKTDAQKTRGHIAELTEELKEDRADVRALRAEVAHLESPARIEELAKENLELRTGAEARRRAPDAMDEALPAPQRARP